MEDFLLSVGVGGDVSFIAEMLADAGMHTIDDLMLAEPSLDDLFDAGIVDEADRLAIYYAVHPEEAPEEGTGPHDGEVHEDALPACFRDDYDPNAPVAELPVDGEVPYHDGEVNPEDYIPEGDHHFPDDYGIGSGLNFDEIERLGQDMESDPLAQEIALISAYLAKLEEDRSRTDDWLVATDPSQSNASFDKAAYTRASTHLQNRNTHAFKQAILDMDVNMRDPEDNGNTLLHWCVLLNNAEAAQAIIDRGGMQLMNADGKTPIELALEAFETDSSFFDVRGVLGRHAQQMLRTTGSISGGK